MCATKQILKILCFFDEYLHIEGITKTVSGPNLYYLFDYDQFDMLIFLFYVDDMVLIVSLKNSIPCCKKKLASEVDMNTPHVLFLGLGGLAELRWVGPQIGVSK